MLARVGSEDQRQSRGHDSLVCGTVVTLVLTAHLGNENAILESRKPYGLDLKAIFAEMTALLRIYMGLITVINLIRLDVSGHTWTTSNSTMTPLTRIYNLHDPDRLCKMTL
jgi:hypothetical protein